MERNEIIRMAREAAQGSHRMLLSECFGLQGIDELERFSNLVAEAERDECLAIAENAYEKFFAEHEIEFPKERYSKMSVERSIRSGIEFVTTDLSKAIRARSQK